MTPRSGSGTVLPRAFYARPTLEVLRDLIGKVLVHDGRGRSTAGVIIEAEAYIGESDPACHAAPGPTPRNAPLYGRPGFSYVYFNYGMHHLVNAVTEREGFPAAVLIRALDPSEGADLMRRRRARVSGRPPIRIANVDLCRGPGNVCVALGIDRRQNRFDLVSSALRIEDRGIAPKALTWSARIGIRVGIDRAWRCAWSGHPGVSGPRSANAVGVTPETRGAERRQFSGRASSRL